MGASADEIYRGDFTPQDNIIHHAPNGCAIGLNCPAPSNGTGWYVDARSNKFVGIPQEIFENRTVVNKGCIVTSQYTDGVDVEVTYMDGDEEKTKTLNSDELWTTTHNTVDHDYTNGFVSGNTFGVYPLHIQGVPASFSFDPLRGFNTNGFEMTNCAGHKAYKNISQLGDVLVHNDIFDNINYSQGVKWKPGMDFSGYPTVCRPDLVVYNGAMPASLITTNCTDGTIANRTISIQHMSDITYVTIDFDMKFTNRPSTRQSSDNGIPVERWSHGGFYISVLCEDLFNALSNQNILPSASQIAFGPNAINITTEYGAAYNPVDTVQLFQGYNATPMDHIYINSKAAVPLYTQTPKVNSVLLGTRVGTLCNWWENTGTLNFNTTAHMSTHTYLDGTISYSFPSFKECWMQYHADNPTLKVLHFALSFACMHNRIPSYNLFKYFNTTNTDGEVYLDAFPGENISLRDNMLSMPALYYYACGKEFNKIPWYPGQGVGPSGSNLSNFNELIQMKASHTFSDSTATKYLKPPYASPSSINVDSDALFNISGECAIGSGFNPMTAADAKLYPTSVYEIPKLDGTKWLQYVFNPSAYKASPTYIPGYYDSLRHHSSDSAGAVLCPFNNNVFVTGEFRYDHFRMGLNMAYFGSWCLTGMTIGTSASLIRPAMDTLDVVSDPSDALMYTVAPQVHTTVNGVYQQDVRTCTNGTTQYTANVKPNGSTYSSIRNCFPNTSDMWQKDAAGNLHKSTLQPYVFGMRSGRYEQPDRNGNYHCRMTGDVWTQPPRGGLYIDYNGVR